MAARYLCRFPGAPPKSEVATESAPAHQYRFLARPFCSTGRRSCLNCSQSIREPTFPASAIAVFTSRSPSGHKLLTSSPGFCRRIQLSLEMWEHIGENATQRFCARRLGFPQGYSWEGKNATCSSLLCMGLFLLFCSPGLASLVCNDLPIVGK